MTASLGRSSALRRAASVALAATAAGLFCTGCGRGGSDATGGDPGTVKVAYLGLTCEAPIYVAVEKGMFAEQGVNVELIKTDWDGLREGLANGNFQANHTLLMYVLKGVERGSDMKITAGVHTGCLRLQVGTKSAVKTAAELRGKKIGVPSNIGSPPAMFASRALAAAGIDPSPDARQVTWVAMDPGQLGQRLEQGELDAVATSDPIGTILDGKGITKTIADQAKDQPYADEYCCVVVVNGAFAKKHPGSAAKVTKGILKAAKWVQENPKAAAELGVEKKYIAASVDINTQALAGLSYIPGVARGKVSVERAAEDMKKAKLLSESTNGAALAKRAWLDLEGVNDEWVVAQAVDRVEGGGAVRLPADRFAALFGPPGSGRCVCCTRCCIE
ncbi:MAG: ABC transporter substrate-binding protein [Gemmataceae bacterium]|nr:ABC transporter substrate-binding protein [Gemmataceae bacterium]